MTDSEARDITVLIGAARGGDATAAERLFAMVYGDLKQIARRHLRGMGGRRGETLRTTALVHEAYLRLARPGGDVNDRVHFFAVASRAMRQIVVDHVRRERAAKRGGGVVPVSLDDVEVGGPPVATEELLALDAALDHLASFDARLGRVVECHFYGGMTFEEIGVLLGRTERTIKRDWRKARAFLHAELADAAPGANTAPAPESNPTDS